MKKIFSVTTDSAPVMMGQHRGFVNLFEQKISYPVMKLHCIVHIENLCAKISNSALDDVMSTVTKIVNFLVARSAFHLFRQRSKLAGSFDLCLKRWKVRTVICLCTAVLDGYVAVRFSLRFVECLVEIKAFLIGQGKAYPELEE